MPSVSAPAPQGSMESGPVTLDALVEHLARCVVQPVSMCTRTIPAMRRRGNPLLERGVICLAGRGGMIGASYESVVNRQRAREGQPTTRDGQLAHFRASSLWRGQGEHVPGNRHLVRHRQRGDLYLVFYPRADRHGQPIDLWREYRWADDFFPLDPSEVEPWLKTSSGSSRPRTAKRIPWRTIALPSIVSIRIAGQVYRVADCTALPVTAAA